MNDTLFRNVSGRMLGGVCAALAQRFGWEVALVRVLLVVSVLFTGGTMFWVYLAFWLVTPFDRGERAPLKKLFDAVLGFFGAGGSTGGVERV